jgi:hypothetical protein
MRWNQIVRLLVITCAASGSLAMESRGQAVPTPSSPPPFNCADTTSRVLGFMIGEYSVDAVFRTGAAAWDSSKAAVSITPDLGGCVLREHFVGTRYGSAYEYLATWSAHGGAAAPVQRTFVHSQHGLLSLSNGTVVADTIVLEDSAFVRGKWIYQRALLWRSSGGDLRNESRRSEDGRATWFVTQRFRYVPRRN